MIKIIGYIIIALLISFMCFGVGYSFGVYHGIKLVVHWGVDIFDIDIDADDLATGIYQYQSRISGCLFLKENALGYNNTGN